MVIAGFQLSGLARSIVYKVLLFLLLFFGGLVEVYAQFYPVHGVVQWPSPQSPHLVDYYSGSRDRLIITLHNRDLQQPLLLARLRVQIKSNGFLAQTREEFPYPMLELMAGTPTRLTATDLMPYLRPENLHFNGRLRNGQLPTGFTEISVQVIDYYSKKVLSTWHTARAYLDSKQPPILNLPQRDEQVAYREPLFIRFQWYPRHQGLAGTEYEFVLKELPDNGATPQAAFAYGNEIYRTRTRNTTLNYTHLEPILLPNRRYAWQVQAIARDGVDEIGMFQNGGFSEIYWFSLNENCPVPTGLKAEPRYAKVDFSWNRVIGATGYMLACRPKTSKDIYEWSEVQSYGERMTLAQLKPGWTYEWRVGTLCTGDKPIYSAVQEVTLPKTNLDLLRDCGKEPPRPNLRPEPALDVRVGDTVTIGGDYPMLITELQSLGDGWYSGRGTTRLSSIIELPRVALRFDRLRINIERCQIDGLVEAIYDEKLSKPIDLDKVDGGGKDIKPSQLRIRTRELAFALPEMPQMSLNTETGEIEVRDAEGKPQRIKLELPEGGDYASAFPMLITDSEGNSYQVSSPESSRGLDDRRLGESRSEDSVGKQKPLKVERVEHIGAFSADTLETKYGFVRFEQGNGRYGFDLGAEKWYQKTTILDAFYKPFGKGYIAPWKLIPVGEQDEGIAKYEGRNISNLAKVRFASAPNSTAIPAEFDESTKTWKLSLPATDANSSYDVFALYEGKVIGKLRVVSYPKQNYKLRLVPVNGQSVGDVSRLSQQLNDIYNKYGVSFTLYEGEGMTATFSSENLKSELKELNKQYKQTHTLTSEDVCIFVVSEELSKGSKYEEVEGLMQRGKRFGYIFAGNSPNEDKLARTLAHELGHGLFTLGHTFDSDYNKGKRGVTKNLMDYAGKEATELAAYQWNIMANPAPFTGFDRDKDAQISRHGTQSVNISSQMSSLILEKGRAVYAPNGKKFLLPSDAVIIGIVYNDYSNNPAMVGSISSFTSKGKIYRTMYSQNEFLYYQSVDSLHTLRIENMETSLDAVKISFDKDKRKITFDGKTYYSLTDDDFRLARSNRVLIQTKTKPGFGLKSERDILEFEDAHGNGLTAPSDTVADDMMYGTSFDLNKIKDPRVRANLERLKEKSDDELFKHVINLAEWVSRGQLQENNKRLIEEWRQQIYQTPKDSYTDMRLSHAVFDNNNVKALVNELKTILDNNIQISKANVDSLNLSTLNGRILRPSFPFSSDRGAGLTFALNDTWGFKVVLTEYSFDDQTGEYLAKVQLDIYDHFGLDVEDVEKYGSKEQILASLSIPQMSKGKLTLGATALSVAALQNPSNIVGGIKEADRLLQEAADGFCSWFILQYIRGYKPFVTMMTKELTIEGNITK